jgi:hypothetical protein
MKHILNNMSEEEKNKIREQHTGGMKVMTESFSRLLNSKLGDSKPLVKEQVVAKEPTNGKQPPLNIKSTYEAIRSTDKQKYQITINSIYTGPDDGYNGYTALIVGPGSYEGKELTSQNAARSLAANANGGYDLSGRETNKISGNSEMGEFTIIRKIK